MSGKKTSSSSPGKRSQSTKKLTTKKGKASNVDHEAKQLRKFLYPHATD